MMEQEKREKAEESEAIAASVRSNLLEAKLRRYADLGAQPGRECEGSFQLGVTLPSGVTMKRRFWLSDTIQCAFDWIDVETSRSHEDGSYRLRMMYPRLLLDSSKPKCFAEAGLGGGNHAAIVEDSALEGSGEASDEESDEES